MTRNKMLIVVGVCILVLIGIQVAKAEDCVIPCTQSCGPEAFYGELAGNFVVSDSDGESLDASMSYFGVGKMTENANVYALYDFSTGTAELQEAAAKFTLFDVYNVTAGRQAVPYGIMYLDRPMTSVFISSPKRTAYADGVGVMMADEFLRVDGFYSNDDLWSFKGEMTFEFANDGILFIPSYSYSNVHEHIISVESTGWSLLAAMSNLTEWNATTGEFWTRFVATPGLTESFGVFASYYNVDVNNMIAIRDFSFAPDAFTAGAFIDVNDVVVSAEWKLDEEFMPMQIQATTRF